MCDPTLSCAGALTCVDGLLYPTGCGPANCDDPIGPCSDTCDPEMGCGDAPTCFGGELYPSTCGPANCDQPIGRCEPGCDPSLGCGEAETPHLRAPRGFRPAALAL